MLGWLLPTVSQVLPAAAGTSQARGSAEADRAWCPPARDHPHSGTTVATPERIWTKAGHPEGYLPPQRARDVSRVLVTGQAPGYRLTARRGGHTGATAADMLPQPGQASLQGWLHNLAGRAPQPALVHGYPQVSNGYWRETLSDLTLRS